MEYKVIVLSGKMGSGKDTLAHAFNEQADTNEGIFCHKLKFADPLYAIHDAVYEKAVKIGIFDKPATKDGTLLQLLGTEWGRKTISEDIWIKAFLNSLERIKHAYTQLPECKKLYVFVTDCRFENEFDCFGNDRNVIKIRLECGRDKRKKRADGWRDNEEHPSETGLDEYASRGVFDYYLDTGVLPIENCLEFLKDCINEHPK